MKKFDRENKIDSRGELVTEKYDIIATSSLNGFSLIYSCKYYGYGNGYAIKVPSVDINKLYSMYGLKRNDNYSVFEEYEFFRNYINKYESRKDFKIQDIALNTLSPGDLVIYNDAKNKKLAYGIIFSDKKIFCEDGLKRRVYFVIKVVNLTKEELVIRNNIVNKYRSQVSKVVSSETKIKIGDIINANGVNYLYLGRINFLTEYIYDSNAIFSDDIIDVSKKYFFKLTGDELPTNLDSLYRMIINSFRYNTVITTEKRYLSEHLYYNYLYIREVKSFVEDINKKDKVIVKHIDLPKILNIRFVDVFHSKCRELDSFQVNIECLG